MDSKPNYFVKAGGCLLRIVLFFVAYALLCILPPAGAAALMFIAVTKLLLQKENRRDRPLTAGYILRRFPTGMPARMLPVAYGSATRERPEGSRWSRLPSGDSIGRGTSPRTARASTSSGLAVMSI